MRAGLSLIPGAPLDRPPGWARYFVALSLFFAGPAEGALSFSSQGGHGKANADTAAPGALGGLVFGGFDFCGAPFAYPRVPHLLASQPP
jgi:hypothetical protein